MRLLKVNKPRELFHDNITWVSKRAYLKEKLRANKAEAKLYAYQLNNHLRTYDGKLK